MQGTVRAVRQRRELTFKHNAELGRHGWLRLTPAYSVKLVEDIFELDQPQLAVFDPFSGTGTTPLAAAHRGFRALATDINPFLIWLATVKTARYSARQQAAARTATRRIVGLLADPGLAPSEPPPLYNLTRWWSGPRLAFLCKLKAAIQRSTRDPSAARNLLMIAFCRIMMGLSNAAFNHQSMSFKPSGAGPARRGHAPVPAAFARQFSREVETVLATTSPNPRQPGPVLRDDARTLQRIARGSFDLLVTSPPYPNRMSYVRELRPYMYWTGHLVAAREAGELDWDAIGGTWGVATSRLADWCAAEPVPLPAELSRAVARIARSDAANARLLSTYVAKYFHDMWQHLAAVADRIQSRGRVHYIVGNSTFYGVLVSTERVFAHMLSALGFQHVQIQVLRKRNSKKELFEFGVHATKA